MKLFFAYSILLCLVFLNVPREFVHDCDHDHVAHMHGEDHKHSEDQNDFQTAINGSAHTTLENEDCFVCEFDLGFFEVPVFTLPKFVSNQFQPVVSVGSNRVSRPDFAAFAHRGPPQLFNI